MVQDGLGWEGSPQNPSKYNDPNRLPPTIATCEGQGTRISQKYYHNLLILAVLFSEVSNVFFR